MKWYQFQKGTSWMSRKLVTLLLPFVPTSLMRTIFGLLNTSQFWCWVSRVLVGLISAFCSWILMVEQPRFLSYKHPTSEPYQFRSTSSEYVSHFISIMFLYEILTFLPRPTRHIAVIKQCRPQTRHPHPIHKNHRASVSEPAKPAYLAANASGNATMSFHALCARLTATNASFHPMTVQQLHS